MRQSALTPQKRAKRTHTHLTTEDLVRTLQASEHEVLAMLTQLHAFEDAGASRRLQPCLCVVDTVVLLTKRSTELTTWRSDQVRGGS